MANYYARESFGKAFTEIRTQTSQAQYFAKAMAEYYESKATKVIQIINLEDSITALVDRIAYMNEEGIGRYLNPSDLANQLYEIDGFIKCYETATSTNFTEIPSSEILSELIDAHVSALGFSRVFSNIADLQANDLLDSSKIMDDLRVYLGTDQFGSKVTDLLRSINQLPAQSALVAIIDDSPAIDLLDEFSVTDYDGNGVNIVASACVSIVEDVTAGIEKVFEDIRNIKDLGVALVNGVTALVTNLTNLLFADLLTDYQYNANAITPGVDLPIVSYRWNDLAEFRAWLTSGFEQISGNPSFWMTTPVDQKVYTQDLRSEQLFAWSNFPMLHFEAQDARQWEFTINKVTDDLSEKGFFETIVNGIRVRLCRTKTGAIQCLQYLTGLVPNVRHVFEAWLDQVPSATQYQKTTSHVSDAYSQLGVDGKIDNSHMLDIVFNNRDSYRGYFVSPIFPDGHLAKNFTQPRSDIFFYSALEDASVNEVAEKLKVVDLPLTDAYLDNVVLSPEIAVLDASTIGQNFILYSLACVFNNPRDIIHGLLYTFTNNYGDTINYLSDWTPTVDEEVWVNENMSLFYPYYTTSTPSTKIHAQTYSERVSEVRDAIIKIIVAAAAVAVAIKAVKFKRKMRNRATQAAAQLKQAMDNFNPADSASVVALSKAERKARMLGKVNSILGVSSAAVDIRYPASVSYDNQFDTIIKSLRG